MSGALSVEFCNERRPFRPETAESEDALLQACEPIIAGLDQLYAHSKMIFLAWPGDAGLRKERERLENTISDRELRIYPEAIAAFEGEQKLRDALIKSATSVHLFGPDTDDFSEKQLDAAIRLGRPCIIGSSNATENRRGPTGSPPPIYLGHGNPISAIADAIDEMVGRGKRTKFEPAALAKTPLFLVYQPGVDYTLGLRIRQRIVNRGPFEIIEPPRTGDADMRYDALARARAAVMCWGRADSGWFREEFDALNRAMAEQGLYDLSRGLFLSPPEGKGDVDPLDTDRVLTSTEELDAFLTGVQEAAA